MKTLWKHSIAFSSLYSNLNIEYLLLLMIGNVMYYYFILMHVLSKIYKSNLILKIHAKPV